MIDLGLPVERIHAALEQLGVHGVELEVSKVLRGGLRATSVAVVATSLHPLRRYADIVALVESSTLDAQVVLRFGSALRKLAEVEAELHGIALQDVEFHEIGAWDTIVDLLTFALGLVFFGIAQVLVGPVETGSGVVKTSHGVFNIPAPATLELLRGFSLTSNVLDSELCTPTGAAILATFAQPIWGGSRVVERTGYGAGSLELLDRPNVLIAAIAREAQGSITNDNVILVETNLDDRSGEFLGELIRGAIAQGALDAWATSVIGKKGRPAVVLSLLCQPQMLDLITNWLFAASGTLGMRMSSVWRNVAPRQIVEVEYRSVRVRVKVGPHYSKIEFDDLVRAAEALGEPILSLQRKVSKLFCSVFPHLPPPV